MRKTARRLSFLWLGVLALTVLGADQASKHAIEHFTPPGFLRVVVPGLLNLIHSNNPGVAFGLFATETSPWLSTLLIAFSGAVIAFLIWLLTTGRSGGPTGQSGLALILGGALGNVLDRLLRQSVTDFIDFHVGIHHWYTFNVADSAIVVGAGLVLLELLSDGRHPRQKKE